jgi:hemerythrin superfamily protein
MLDEFQEVLDDIEENGFDLDEMIAEINRDQRLCLIL